MTMVDLDFEEQLKETNFPDLLDGQMPNVPVLSQPTTKVRKVKSQVLEKRRTDRSTHPATLKIIDRSPQNSPVTMKVDATSQSRVTMDPPSSPDYTAATGDIGSSNSKKERRDDSKGIKSSLKKISKEKMDLLQTPRLVAGRDGVGTTGRVDATTAAPSSKGVAVGGENHTARTRIMKKVEPTVSSHRTIKRDFIEHVAYGNSSTRTKNETRVLQNGTTTMKTTTSSLLLPRSTPSSKKGRSNEVPDVSKLIQEQITSKLSKNHNSGVTPTTLSESIVPPHVVVRTSTSNTSTRTNTTGSMIKELPIINNTHSSSSHASSISSMAHEESNHDREADCKAVAVKKNHNEINSNDDEAAGDDDRNMHPRDGMDHMKIRDDAHDLLERARDRISRQRLSEQVKALEMIVERKNTEMEQLHSQLRRAVETKSDLVVAHNEIEKRHVSMIEKKEQNLLRMKQANIWLLEAQSLKEKELLNEIIRLTDVTRDLEQKHREELDDWERMHRNEMLEKDYMIAKLSEDFRKVGVSIPSPIYKQQQQNQKGLPYDPTSIITGAAKYFFH
jgi:hypothetical protein